RVQHMWPTDLQLRGRKLGGILVEARWRDQRVDWVAIGIGLNVTVPPDLEGATGLQAGSRRVDVLAAVMPAMRLAAAAEGPFSEAELARYAARDVTAGRRIVRPAEGVVAGVAASGELLVDTGTGRVACHGGSLVFAEEG
ncbi:MAG: biotin--[acetyl-CoA-carboxylase] ligase, partial [Gemmatimonadaceae bacterium]